MALPQTNSPLTPNDSDSPSQGAAQIRGIKQYLTDVFGAPNATAVTIAPMSFSATGVMSILQSPLTIPTLIQGNISQVLRIAAQYSQMVFEVNGASVMALTTTGMLRQTPWVEWVPGVTGFLGTQGTTPLTFRTNSVNQVSIASGGAVTFASSGPHAIGVAANARFSMFYAPTLTLTGGAFGSGWSFQPTLTGPSGQSFYAVDISPGTLTATGTSADVASLLIQAPALSGTVTAASSLKILSAPTGGGVNYALWCAPTAAPVRMDSTIVFGTALSTVTTTAASIFSGQSGFLTLNSGSTCIQFVDNTGLNERARLTNGGVFLVGTSVSTNATGGDIVIPVSHMVRSVNQAGNDTVRLINLNSANEVNVAGGSTPSLTVIGNPGSSSGAAVGEMVLGNAKGILFSNAAGSAALSALILNSSNALVVGNAATIGTVVVGSGSVATFTASGGQQLGAPTGGDKGAGTLNVSSGYYVNGSLVAPSFTAEFISSDQTVTFSSVLTVAHGLGAKPKMVQVTLKNAITELSYTVGDEVPMNGDSSTGNTGLNVVFDGTNVVIVTGTAIALLNKSNQNSTNITAANWKYVVRAWK